MAKIFLDTNTFIDVVEGRDKTLFDTLSKNTLFVSVASISIWVYVYKHKILSKKNLDLFSTFNFVDHTAGISKKSFKGPTDDFEDNVQLHSAVKTNCILFLTKDKGLLKLGYFGNTKISDTITFE